jgi:FtsP/CotA-like multicopper oxidase with cupredoxin domain
MVAAALRHRRLTLTAFALSILAGIVIAARWPAPAQATSGGDPYVVPLVTDVDPDPNVVETTITAEPAGVDIGGGITASALTFNHTIPGPEFRLKVGDTVKVHFVNNIAHATGIHWHGIELANPNDGTPLTQDMVPPGGTFEYKFKVTRPGVFWYHPHHHSSTNQVFKGMYGSIIVTDPNEAPLQASGVLPSTAQTRTLVLSDVTVCKSAYANPPGSEPTYDPSLPWVGGGPLPAQSPTPETICKNPLSSPAVYPVDEDGNHRATAFAGGEIPNIQPGAPTSSPVTEGNIVLTNGINVGGRAGSPSAPGALAFGAFALDVQPGQGLRLQILNTATTRFFRLLMTDNSGTQIPLVRVGGTGGLLDNARTEGGVVSGFDFKYTSGEVLIDPGDRVDVVVAIPASATGALTMWTQDFDRTGNGFANIPTVPVMHLNVTGSVVNPAYTIANGTPLRAATGNPVEVLGPATASLLDPSTFTPAQLGTPDQNIELSNQVSGKLGINGHIGLHDNPNPPPFTTFPHTESSRYAEVGDSLELTVENKTQGAHHPFHLHGFSMQPLSLTKAAGGGPDYTFAYREFRDTVDVPPGYKLHFRVRLDDRPMDDGVTPGGAVGRWVFHCHIFFHAVFGMISEFVVLPSTKPILSLPGDQTQDYHDFLTFNISATDPNNDPITLSSTALPAGLTLVDHGDGTATISGTLTATPGAYPVTFSASDGNNPPVNGTLTINVTKEETGLVYTGPTVILNGGNLTLSAVLKEETDSSGPAIAGRTVNMALGAQSCSGATNVSGVAQCDIVVNGALGASTPISADFAGDTFYRPSSAAATAIVFAFPTGGAFALGDTSASSPGTKTFWASVWSNVNVLTGGDAPSAFKGFTNNVSLPTSNPPASCGGPWTTSGGNSAPPPATVPSYMGVLVSSNVSKGGPTISGNTVKIVVVKVNPGYGPNPGSAGTGTVVGVFCP